MLCSSASMLSLHNVIHGPISAVVVVHGPVSAVVVVHGPISAGVGVLY